MGKDCSQCLLGAQGTPLRSTGCRAPTSPAARGFSAHRLGQTGLVQGDESACKVGMTSLPSMSQPEPGLGAAGRGALLSCPSSDEDLGMASDPRWGEQQPGEKGLGR